MRSFTIFPLLYVCFLVVVEGRRALFQSTRGITFPNYSCQDDPSLSPFKLEPAYTTSPSANGQRICFTGAPIQRCPTEEPCCSQADFYKLEIYVRPTCRRAIRSVTVNGMPAPTSTFELYGLQRDKALFRLPRLNLTTANATGAKICITLHDPCPNFAALCPEGDGSCTYAIGQSTSSHRCCPINKLGLVPPPPPPAVPSNPVPSKRQQPPPLSPQEPVVPTSNPPARWPAPYAGTFPYLSTCNQTTGLMPFRLMGAPVPSRTISGGNVYCFSLVTSYCVESSSSCCSSNLFKVDWWSYDTCRGSVVQAYVDRVPYKGNWDQGGTFRLTKLSISPEQVAVEPRQLCIELRKDGPCDTIQKFCRQNSNGGCTYALYDGSQTCCPVDSTPVSR